ALRADVRAEWDDDLSRLEAGATFPGVEFYAAYLESGRPSLFDHLPAQVVVLDFEPQRQLADARSITEDTTMLAAAEAENGELPARFELPAVELSRLELDPARPAIEMSAGELDGEALDIGWTDAEPLVGRKKALAALAKQAEGSTVVVATEQNDRFRELLEADAVRASVTESDLDVDMELDAGLHLAEQDLPAGCSQSAIGFNLLTDAELFGRVRRPSPRRGSSTRARAEELTREFTLEFAPGELVVHVDHGIARFGGMRLIDTDGVHREYLELEYAEADRLFVPVENLDRIQKFLGADHGAGAAALPRFPRAAGELPCNGGDAVAVRRRRDSGADDRGLEGGAGRHRHRHSSPPPEGREVQAPRPAGRRRGAPVWRHAEGAAEEAAHAARRAVAVGHAHPAHAAHGRRRHPRHERDPDAARGEAADQDVRHGG